jgi:hypothetical protein
MTEPLLRLDQLAKALNLPRSLLAQIPPARPARGRYVARYSLAVAREHLRHLGIAVGPDEGAVPT